MSFGENHLVSAERLTQARGYTVSAMSGLVTGLSLNDLVFGLRNVGTVLEGGVAAPVEPVVVTAIRVRWATTTAFASAQAMIFRGYKVYGYTAIQSSGGTAVNAHYKRPGNVRGVASAVGKAVLTDLSAYVSATGAITGGTFTAQTAGEPEFMAVGAGSTLPGVYEDVGDGALQLPMILETNQGLVVDCGLAMGSSGVGRFFIDVECHRPNIG
jgi:hypothetical protein